MAELMDNNSQRILYELERLWESFNSFKDDSTDRLARIETKLEPLSTIPDRVMEVETKVEPLFDSGQPGLLTTIQNKIGDLNKFRHITVGIYTAAGAVLGWIITALIQFIRVKSR